MKIKSKIWLEKEVNIRRIDKDGKRDIRDKVTQETPITIYVDDKELVTLLCSPNNLKELSVGFLYSAGLIRSKDDIKGVTIDEQNRISYIELNNNPDFMNKRQVLSKLEIPSEKIIKLMSSFQKASVAFKETGGVHSAALSNEDDIVVFKEDIGRHNAVDKVVGEALMKNLDMKTMLLLTSGRITSEIVFKVQKTGLPIIVSRSAPTDQAVKLADACNLTLVGFARGKRMNIYTAKERIQ